MQLKQFHNKNQFIIIDGQKIYFQSYGSMIACYDDETKKLTLGKNWNYSNTTRKHLYLFLIDYLGLCGKEIYNLRVSKNKRDFIQSLIDDGIINYDEKL